MGCVKRVFIIQVCRAGDPCPPPEDMQHCICTSIESPAENQPKTLENTLSDRETAKSSNHDSNSIFTTVECNYLPSIYALEEDTSSGLKRREIEKLRVSRVPPEKEHTLARLPKAWLKNTRVRHIEIFDSKLYNDFLWHGSPFEGQEQSLLVLTVKKCFLYGALTHGNPGTVHTRHFSALPKVETIDFSQNLLTVVTSSAFDNAPVNLSIINLSHNSIHTLDSGAFKKVLNLKSLDLSHNMLKGFAREVLPPTCKRLETINLSWNFIKVLPANLFANMMSLKRVLLEKNYLHSMPNLPWITVWSQLSFINVEGNFINCDCDLLWLLNATSVTSENSSRKFKGTCSYNKIPEIQGIEYPLNDLQESSFAICETKMKT